MKKKYCITISVYDDISKHIEEQEELFLSDNLKQAQDKMEELIEEYQDMQLATDCSAVIELAEFSENNKKILDSEAVGLCVDDEEYSDEYDDEYDEDNDYDEDDYEEDYEDDYDEDETYEDESY